MATVYTVGHSTRAADEFRDLLTAYAIEQLVDVRQFPGSRRYPHFSSAALAESLAASRLGQASIQYVHLRDLGGRRKSTADSQNAFWRSASFRAFADYMATPPFRAALDHLIELASQRTTAIMCAEAVPWRCHRWLISDALVAHGLDVVHVISPASSQPHVLNPQARATAEGFLIYPAAEAAD